MKSVQALCRKAPVALSFLALIMLGLSACKKDDSGSTPNVGSALMAFNLAVDNDNLGIALSGNSLNNAPLAFTGFTGNYLPIYPGERAIEAYDFSTDSTLANSSFNFENSKYYSLFVIGNKGVYKNLVAKDEFDSLGTDSGQAYIRYVNAIPDSAAPVVSIKSGGNDVVGENALFGVISNFTGITPGEIAVGVNDENSISASRTITIEAGKAYTVLLVGDPAASDSSRAVQIRYIENGTLTD